MSPDRRTIGTPFVMDADEVLTPTDDWSSAFPGAAVGALVMREVANPGLSDELEAAKRRLEDELQERAARLGPEGIRDDPIVHAYRDHYRPRGATYPVRGQWESVALKGRQIPTRAALVEAMFMAELRHLILTAGHDLRTLTLPLTVDVTREGDRYELMSGVERAARPGDMSMRDAAGIVSTVILGPDRRSRITPETREVLFAAYAPAGIGEATVRRHLDEIRHNVLLVAPAADTAFLGTLVAAGQRVGP